jgi:hypothetical protein
VCFLRAFVWLLSPYSAKSKEEPTEPRIMAADTFHQVPASLPMCLKQSWTGLTNQMYDSGSRPDDSWSSSLKHS